MANLNKVMLIGHVGKDPEIRMIPSGKSVANFSIATTEKYTDKSGQKVETTEWCNIVIWEPLSKIVEQYVKKGNLLYLEGKIKTRTWDDPDGKKCYATDIVCHSMQMLGGRDQESGAPQTPGMPPEFDPNSSPF